MKAKIFFLCPGLGRITRGYESFIKECHEVFLDYDKYEITLFKSGGLKLKQSKNLPCLYRRSKLTKIIASLFGKHPYYIEQATFALAAIPYVLLKKPDLIFLSDGALANAIWHIRRIFRLKFKILFSNGGPLPTALKRWDHVQQLVPAHFDRAIADGVAAEKQTLLPYGASIKSALPKCTSDEKAELRRKLGLPSDRLIIISVGTINKHHKRMDYLIEEMNLLTAPRPFLLILGQEEKETPEIRELALKLLGADNFTIRNVELEEMNQYYRSSDIFTLASLHEGLARVFLEAYAKGLPCIAHDYEVPRFALGEFGYYIDMQKKGSLKDKIAELINEGDYTSKSLDRYEYAYNNFSWDVLKERYIQLFDKVLNGAPHA